MLKKKLLTDKSGSLYDQMIEESAKRLAEDIDAEVIRQMLKDSGYFEVVIPWIMTHEMSQEVDEWVNKNVKGKFWNRGLCWLFNEERDAMWFSMKWMSV